MNKPKHLSRKQVRDLEHILREEFPKQPITTSWWSNDLDTKKPKHYLWASVTHQSGEDWHSHAALAWFDAEEQKYYLQVEKSSKDEDGITTSRCVYRLSKSNKRQRIYRICPFRLEKLNKSIGHRAMFGRVSPGKFKVSPLFKGQMVESSEPKRKYY